MSTGAIIAIVVVALLIILALAVLLPRARASSRVRQQERELNRRRELEVERHREEADVRGRQADEAERRATIAAKEAQAERAQAEAHEARAGLHERGMADDELIGDDERDRFSDVTPGSRSVDDEPAGVRDDAERTRFGRPVAAGDADAASTEYQQGRRDEARDERRQ
jgi:hypothetical protein